MCVFDAQRQVLETLPPATAGFAIDDDDGIVSDVANVQVVWCVSVCFVCVCVCVSVSVSKEKRARVQFNEPVDDVAAESRRKLRLMRDLICSEIWPISLRLSVSDSHTTISE